MELASRSSRLLSTLVPKTSSSRLPSVLGSPTDEFPSLPPWTRMKKTSLQIQSRLFQSSLSSCIQPTQLTLLFLCSSCVYGISYYEASLYLANDNHYSLHYDFMISYANHNFLPSCIWSSCPPELVAQALDGSTTHSVSIFIHLHLNRMIALPLQKDENGKDCSLVFQKSFKNETNRFLIYNEDFQKHNAAMKYLHS